MSKPSVEALRIVDCTEQQHSTEILDILNDAIMHSTALYDYKPRTQESMVQWFKTKRTHQFPVIGAVNAQGQLMGFASFGTFRAFPAYKYTVEHSVYIHKDFRGQGLSTVLMQALIERAKAADVHVMVGCIDATNVASIKLHEKLGFRYSGTITQAGFKFGRWLDAAFYQLTLETPVEPCDDV
ncbi:GNAT family N-acetyltransferase [uncultured Acinetobacter sp.]|uniref:GNAT family N-acetyltransferase n=1 Tax=uncultured Acinetobacter sp. TaxID=165433 RepID=UPI00258C1A0D|nr:GNAT family N-acetyltransferase [uncultured Acinetobacter sp.]